MAGLVKAMVTGQNLAPKDQVALEPLAGGATLAQVIAEYNKLLATLKANGLVK